MESNVVTLDTAKKLKAAGFPQRTYYMWRYHLPNGGSALNTTEYHTTQNEVHKIRNRPDVQERFESENEFYAAPTAQEIADQLPEGTSVAKAIGSKLINSKNLYNAWGGDDEDLPIMYGATMAEALAALWLKLQEAK